MMSRRKFSREVKLEAVRRLESGESSAVIGRSLEIHRSDLHRWRRELREQGEDAFRGAGRARVEEDLTAQLERKIGQQTLEIDFLKRALQHAEEQRQLRALTGGARSTSRSRKNSRRGGN